MNELTNLANKLDCTVNAARTIIKKYGYKSSNLTPEITDYIYRQEKGINQEIFTGSTDPTKPASEEPVDGISYLELVQDESQAQTLFSLAKSFDLDPMNIPKNEVETLQLMLEDATIVQQANRFLSESEQALITSQFTDFKVKIESTIISSELAAEIAFKAGKSAYNRRLLELKEEDRESFQKDQEKLHSRLIGSLLTNTDEFNVTDYQNKAIGGHNRFFDQSKKRLKMMSIQ